MINNDIRKRGQLSFEMLILVGIVLLVAIVVPTYHITKTKADMEIRKAHDAARAIAENAQRASQLGSGNKIPAKIEIPNSINEIRYENNEVIVEVVSGNDVSDFNQKISVNIIGFDFTKDGHVVPGSYDVVFEAFADNVCIYTPGNRKEDCGT